MTESSWPFDNQDSTETQFSLLFRRTQDTGVLDGYGPFGGVLKPYADSSGMNVKVPAGDAVVQGFYYRSDAVNTLTVTASASTARIDSVVLRMDAGANTITALVKAGTAGSGSAPNLTQTDTVYELKLADVAVPANTTSIAAGNVTDARGFSSSNWGRWTSSTRPSSPEYGRSGFNYTLGVPEYWNGSSWNTFGQSTTSASALTSGTLPNARLDYGTVASVRGDRTMDAPVDQYGQINGDWNIIYQPGVYRVFAGNTNSNSPISSMSAYPYGTLMVIGGGNTTASRTQVYYAHTGYVYHRTAWNYNDWGSWKRLANADEVGGGGSVAATSTFGSINFGSNVSNNRTTDVIKTGRQVTVRFNIMINGSKPAGGGSDSNLFQVANSDMWPRNDPADGFCHNGSSLWGFAVDPDGWARLRSGGIGGGGLWGTISYPSAS